MQLQCSRCRKVLDFSGDPPSFCAYCGSALKDTSPPLPKASEAETLAPTDLPLAPAVPPAADVPEVIGGYRLLRTLGCGGMGTVYEAEETATGRHVALKLIARDYAASPEAVDRFRQEGRLASAVSHPRCVFVLAADEANGRPYIVMELMPGPTLQDLLDSDGPLSPRQAVAKILDVIEGLREAHRLDVIHRDVKPSNCFLEANGRVKIGDFGLSRSLSGGLHITRTGAFLGTVLYAAPEQVRGERADRQSDLYAAAATLYTLLVGRAPFQTGDAAATLARIVADDPPPLRDKRPDVPGTLERVILRGLERDRSRRWRDLEEFRLALLPFAPGRESPASLGTRFVALLLDCLVIWPVGAAVRCLFALLLTGDVRNAFNPSFTLRFDYMLLGPTIFILYFTLMEGRGDASLGKRALGLRVRTANNDLPGLGRGLARTFVFYPLCFLGAIGTQFLFLAFFGREAMADPMKLARDWRFLAVALAQYPLYAVGWGLLFGSMRARNGYRGLHEWASGTRVITLPRPDERRALRPRRLGEESAPLPGGPGRVGPFQVRGSLGQAGAGTVLLGEDPTLGRQVLLWVRPSAEPPLRAARRELGRAARLRWLAGGVEGDHRWDAFPVPRGCPLPDWIAAAGPLPWRYVRPLLEELAGELDAARADETLPPRLGPEQVWVDEQGGVQLVDVALTGASPTQSDLPPDERAAAFLVEAATLALEGKPRAAGEPPAPVRAPLPLHARPLVDRLLGVRRPFKSLGALREALAENGRQPAEVTRPRRTAQAALFGVFVLFGLCVLFASAMRPIFEAVRASTEVMEADAVLQAVKEGAERDFVVTALGPAPGSRLTALAQLRGDRQLAERVEAARDERVRLRDAQRDYLGTLGRGYSGLIEQQALPVLQATAERRAALSAYRASARGMIRPVVRDYDAPLIGELITVGFAPALWFVWSLLLRGGLSLRLAGLDLVTRDGRRAGRFLCASRTFLVWLPPMVLLGGSAWLGAVYWTSWQAGAPAAWASAMAFVTWWLGVALLPGYVALAILFPARGPHDRLAGTWVVPR